MNSCTTHFLLFLITGRTGAKAKLLKLNIHLLKAPSTSKGTCARYSTKQLGLCAAVIKVMIVYLPSLSPYRHHRQTHHFQERLAFKQPSSATAPPLHMFHNGNNVLAQLGYCRMNKSWGVASNTLICIPVILVKYYYSAEMVSPDSSSVQTFFLFFIITQKDTGTGFKTK